MPVLLEDSCQHTPGLPIRGRLRKAPESICSPLEACRRRFLGQDVRCPVRARSGFGMAGLREVQGFLTEILCSGGESGGRGQEVRPILECHTPSGRGLTPPLLPRLRCGDVLRRFDPWSSAPPSAISRLLHQLNAQGRMQLHAATRRASSSRPLAGKALQQPSGAGNPPQAAPPRSL